MRSPAPGTSTITLPGASINPYHALGEYLNERWRQQRGREVTIRCAPRGEQLLVLVEHEISFQPPVTETFELLKSFLEAAPAEVWTSHPDLSSPPETCQVNFFIRVLNQKQSYADAQETIEPLHQGTLPSDGDPEGPLLLTAASEENPSPGMLEDPEFSGEVALDPEMAAAFSPNHLRLEPLPEDSGTESSQEPGISTLEGQEGQEIDGEAETQEAEPRASAHSESDAFGGNSGPENDDAAAQLEDSHEEYEEEEIVQDPIHIPKSIWVAGLGLSVMMFTASFYIASRPCWFRSCPPLMAAQEQGEQANGMLRVASTWDDLEQARLRLDGALRQLRAVPGWTSYGEQARGLRTRNRRLLKSLTPIQDALEQAEVAQEKSGVGALKIKQWQEVQVHWEAAIAQLKGVAPESPMYALAQDKLAQYEANLDLSVSRLAEEQEAQRLLSEARSYAGEAPDRNDDLETLEFLRRTQIKLQDALFTLRKVPRGTTAYTEAVRLMSRYESELSLNQGQQTREEFIVNSYRDALGSAESAKIAEANDRWTDAEDYWKAAITSINQIPSGSSYYTRAQGLVSEYAYSLQKAEEKAQQFAALQEVRDELAEVCEGSPLVCTYRVTPQLISVTLTLDYERAILTAGAVGDEGSRVSALNHVHALETALEKTSNGAQIPLELYDPDGVLVGTHQPRASFGAI